MQNDLNKILESILFTAGRPLKAKELAKVLNLEEQVVTETLEQMVEQRKDFGIVLLKSGQEYQLATNNKYSTEVKTFLNAELREKLTDATVEVLAIIAYRQPISKAEIEAIRGVNSQYSVRNLLMRGLIEKSANSADARSVNYQTTTEFLMHMGITSVKDLPEFEKLTENIKLPITAGLTQNIEVKVAENTPATQAQESVQEPENIIEEKIQTPPAEKAEEDEEEFEDDEDDEDDDEEET